MLQYSHRQLDSADSATAVLGTKMKLPMNTEFPQSRIWCECFPDQKQNNELIRLCVGAALRKIAILI